MDEFASKKPPPDATTRFSSRVANYVKYRPGYPQAVVDCLKPRLPELSDVTVADIGSGTGKLSELFLANGMSVIGVEPNREMREASDALLGGLPGYRSADGTAEATNLPDACADLIAVGQALHWFDLEKARAECGRVLKPGGWVAVIYNERSVKSPFLQAYETFLQRHADRYGEVNHRNIDDAAFNLFFGPTGYEIFEFANRQRFDFEGLLGRYLSSSYSYAEDHPRHVDARAALQALFDEWDEQGGIYFEYETRVYIGPLR